MTTNTAPLRKGDIYRRFIHSPEDVPNLWADQIVVNRNVGGLESIPLRSSCSMRGVGVFRRGDFRTAAPSWYQASVRTMLWVFSLLFWNAGS